MIKSAISDGWLIYKIKQLMLRWDDDVLSGYELFFIRRYRLFG